MNSIPESLAARDVIDALRAQGASVTALSADSRRVHAGEVFVAYPGHRSDGRRYIGDAVAAGAGAVLWEREGHAWDSALGTPNVAVDGLQPLSGHLANLVYGRPSEKMDLIGVTGTNGKTSVSQWIAQALTRLGRKCAVIGTLGNGFPGALEDSLNTTPDGIALHSQLARYLQNGARAAAMEVSSIGLDQGRTNGARFGVAVFTNLTRDHLDYHGSMEAYAAAKARMFSLPGVRVSVVNLDDAFGRAQAQDLIARGHEVIGYTMRPEADALPGLAATLAASAIRTTGTGVHFRLEAEGDALDAHASLVGDFNVMNLLAVIGSLRACGVSLREAVTEVAHLTPPPGRMQPLGGVGEPLIVVDYAHSPDALEKVLSTLKSTAAARRGRIVCVFGCGGDRDPGKRPLMGEVASRLADEVVITSDNPRSEDPLAIIAQIAAGAGGNANCIADRGEAIRETILRAHVDDVIVLAGKGHEPYQEVQGVRQHFSDVEEAREALTLWRTVQEGRG